MRQYEADSRHVKILPFDLARFNLPEDYEKTINAYFSEDKLNKNGFYMLKGHIRRDDKLYQLMKSLGLTIHHFSYSGYGSNKQYKMVFDFAEGDIYLVLLENIEDYNKEFKQTEDFYKEN